MMIKVTPRRDGDPHGKLGDAEVIFTEGLFDGLKLTGFAIWEGRAGGNRNVTFPARSYTTNGERRSFALLRPVVNGLGAAERVREAILTMYAEWEATGGTT